MDQADFSGFLKTIIIILFIYYFIKFSMRLFGPYIMKKAMNKVQENFQKKAEDFYNQSQSGGFDFSNANQTQNQSSKVNLKEKKKVGEYIDYEEID